MQSAEVNEAVCIIDITFAMPSFGPHSIFLSHAGIETTVLTEQHEHSHSNHFQTKLRGT